MEVLLFRWMKGEGAREGGWWERSELDVYGVVAGFAQVMPGSSSLTPL